MFPEAGYQETQHFRAERKYCAATVSTSCSTKHERYFQDIELSIWETPISTEERETPSRVAPLREHGAKRATMISIRELRNINFTLEDTGNKENQKSPKDRER